MKMKIRMIIFDLDGVLIDSRDIHYISLNDALVFYGQRPIDYEEHLQMFDGNSTRYKLDLLERLGRLTKDCNISDISAKKQDLTINLISNIEPSYKITEMLDTLKKEDYIVCIASNSIKKTVEAAIKSLNISKYIDYYVSNEDVSKHKPSAEIYFKCMTEYNFMPQETIIVEDSLTGICSSIRSGAYTLPLKRPSDLTIDLIREALRLKNYVKNSYNLLKKVYVPNLVVVIPMAGSGSKFLHAGFKEPKPLIKIHGEPMIKMVLENLDFIPEKMVFIVNKEHEDRYKISEYLRSISVNSEIIFTGGTEGSACTVLLAQDLFKNKELLIVNSDQYLLWKPYEFLSFARNYDGCISVFKEKKESKKWSYTKLNENGSIKISEKIPTSQFANTGLFYFKNGSQYIDAANKMISKNIRVLGEFFIAPVYNECPNDIKISVHLCNEMNSLKNPEDIALFMTNH